MCALHDARLLFRLKGRATGQRAHWRYARARAPGAHARTSDDGGHVLCAADGGHVLVWDVGAAAPRLCASLSIAATAACFAPGTRAILAADTGGTVHMYSHDSTGGGLYA